MRQQRHGGDIFAPLVRTFACCRCLLLLFFFAASISPVFFSQSWAAELIHLKGSDTMYILAMKLADTYMKEIPGVIITVESGGTKTGVEALMRDRADIAQAS